MVAPWMLESKAGYVEGAALKLPVAANGRFNEVILALFETHEGDGFLVVAKQSLAAFDSRQSGLQTSTL
jgi:hypothetical protein